MASFVIGQPLKCSAASIVCPDLHGSAQMENPMKASTATLRTIIAIAATSMVESRLDAMHQSWWQSSGSVDLGQPRWPKPSVRQPTQCQSVRQGIQVPAGRWTTGAAQRISGTRTIGGGDAHRVFTAAQNCSVTAALSSATRLHVARTVAFAVSRLFTATKSMWLTGHPFRQNVFSHPPPTSPANVSNYVFRCEAGKLSSPTTRYCLLWFA
jgi:hypothetical protein